MDDPVKFFWENRPTSATQAALSCSEQMARISAMEGSMGKKHVMTDNEILDIAVEHGIGVRVMPDDYCDLIGAPRGTRYIAENVRPEYVISFARLMLEKGAYGVSVRAGDTFPDQPVLDGGKSK